MNSGSDLLAIFKPIWLIINIRVVNVGVEGLILEYVLRFVYSVDLPIFMIWIQKQTKLNIVFCFKSVTVSSENRRLMEDILKRSQDNQDQMSSRVTALLAGSSLTTTAGVRIDRRDTIDQIDYTAVGEQILFFSKVRSSYHPLKYFFNIFISIFLP